MRSSVDRSLMKIVWCALALVAVAATVVSTIRHQHQDHAASTIEHQKDAVRSPSSTGLYCDAGTYPLMIMAGVSLSNRHAASRHVKDTMDGDKAGLICISNDNSKVYSKEYSSARRELKTASKFLAEGHTLTESGFDVARFRVKNTNNHDVKTATLQVLHRVNQVFNARRQTLNLGMRFVNGRWEVVRNNQRVVSITMIAETSGLAARGVKYLRVATCSAGDACFNPELYAIGTETEFDMNKDN